MWSSSRQISCNCLRVVNLDSTSNGPQLTAVPNPLTIQNENKCYPKVDTGGGRFPTLKLRTPHRSTRDEDRQEKLLQACKRALGSALQ
jgi:hypothetical protein